MVLEKDSAVVYGWRKPGFYVPTDDAYRYALTETADDKARELYAKYVEMINDVCEIEGIDPGRNVFIEL